MLFQEIDVSQWPIMPIPNEPMGMGPKRWLYNPNPVSIEDPCPSKCWLMKDITSGYTADGQEYQKGDDWAERIACLIAEKLKIPAATVELAVEYSDAGKTYGVICKSMLDVNEKIVYGNTFVKEQGISLSEGNQEYYLEQVHDAFQRTSNLSGIHNL